MGAAMSTGAVAAWATGRLGPAWVLVAMILAAATLEAVFALCLGCKVFALLVRAGVVPDSVCAACADITRRRLQAAEPAMRLP
jgi:hypothetical protein